MVIKLDPFQVEDLSLEGVDQNVFLFVLGLGEVVGPDGSFGIV